MKENVLRQIKELDMLVLRMINKGCKDEQVHKNPPTITQMQILEYILNHSNEDIYQKDLENIFNLSRATVSGVLQTMEKYDFIERITDKVDTRTKKIILKQKTKDIFDSHQKKFKEVEEIILKDISEGELKIFMRVIEQMKENIANSF